MKDKSDKSLKAAEALIDTQQVFGFNASIHCSYYALLQYMKYKLTICSNPLPYNRQEKKGCSSHIFILEQVEERIIGSVKKRTFSRIFYKLKRKRVKADYSRKDFTKEESSKYKESIENAIKMLNQYLN